MIPEIKKADSSHLPVIARFNQEMALETENKVLPDEIILPGVKAVLDDPSKGFYLIAEVNGEMAGQLMITYEWSDWRNATIWWIQSVYVVGIHRKKGLYSALYDHVKEQAKKAGVKTIRLYVEKQNSTAQEVYRRLGMEPGIYDFYEATL